MAHSGIKERPIKLTIHLVPKDTLFAWMVKRAVRACVILSMMLGIPIANHLHLGGGWALDFVGGILGFLIAVSILQDLSRRTETFDNIEDAIRWLNSKEWE